MDSIFEFLFKYRSLVFEQGDFVFAAPASTRLWIGVVGVLAASAVAGYVTSWSPGMTFEPVSARKLSTV